MVAGHFFVDEPHMDEGYGVGVGNKASKVAPTQYYYGGCPESDT